jgi:hypothetical protein
VGRKVKYRIMHIKAITVPVTRVTIQYAWSADLNWALTASAGAKKSKLLRYDCMAIACINTGKLYAAWAGENSSAAICFHLTMRP